MIGWRELESDIEMLSDVKTMCRLDTFTINVTVPNRKKLRELAWLTVENGFKVNIHTPDFISILGGKNDERVISARVRMHDGN